MLQELLAPQRLEGQDQYLCANCNKKQDATKTIAISSAPVCLVFTLLRFAYNSTTQRREKVLVPIDIPPTIALSTESGSQLVYDLVALVVHSGSSPNSGHYYCYAQDQQLSSKPTLASHELHVFPSVLSLQSDASL
eukprot:m.635884 g.635884  ORF g.635884 m.635884 type:complete len:136 (+) comp58304_c0_seq71:2065-2472(+)